ncbi:hypothetical protein [Microvirga guangxiensis]|uniref:UrcA family protein n=1 Tax=Microvirga guangxiensis TaxID=549386 RepID=A0A1G5DR09_9HYPH|nr:hypothetical protein [Microvirga guangxiensis]SCY17202.1 hypothetical protein SAMN02927923_00754 [Microvirga guangxiensis]
MRKILGILAVAGFTALSAGTASAQGVGVSIGPDGVRLEERRPVYRERVERRYVRPARTRTVCRTVMEERVRRNGDVVRRPVERCREVVGSRRVYVD